MDRLGMRKALGDLEADIMELIWKWAPDVGVTLRAVAE